MIGRAALSCAVLAALVMPTAGAQSVLPPNLAGLWSFEADVQSFCTFNGQARLIPTEDPATFDCELTAQQECSSVDVRYVVEQSCTVEIEDNVAIVQSRIENFLEGEPTSNYVPDNFQLLIRSESHLEGILVGVGAYPAEWRRAEGAIS